ncbi:hypothetical protein HBH53_144800 [Parastagonospora nodorum]|nr:hypothetical protein HBH53_144800 [Parastagonospora nodorum]KAH4225777.1 hypothetical protein HBI06_112030 [Parastagonospora nodorum]KAH4247378.1 hypothetical protein HBI05_044420 [Parastagonospora nodorum]KAH4907979.1 hypothetical protein HBI80_064290 [Parastagonospora nodorum]KAH5163327.1 hypothetical protein HBI73_048590 [Parastagonospora nodorum]
MDFQSSILTIQNTNRRFVLGSSNSRYGLPIVPLRKSHQSLIRATYQDRTKSSNQKSKVRREQTGNDTSRLALLEQALKPGYMLPEHMARSADLVDVLVVPCQRSNTCDSLLASGGALTHQIISQRVVWYLGNAHGWMHNKFIPLDLRTATIEDPVDTAVTGVTLSPQHQLDWKKTHLYLPNPVGLAWSSNAVRRRHSSLLAVTTRFTPMVPNGHIVSLARKGCMGPKRSAARMKSGPQRSSPGPCLPF